MLSFFKEKLALNVGQDVGNITEHTHIDTATEALSIDDSTEELQWTIYDIIKTIKDPEKPNNLEELNVVDENLVKVYPFGTSGEKFVAHIEFVPTIQHCSLAPLIGLCIRTKLERCLPSTTVKLDIFVKQGTHSTVDEINKQINDKERVAAALENPNLLETVEMCIKEDE